MHWSHVVTATCTFLFITGLVVEFVRFQDALNVATHEHESYQVALNSTACAHDLRVVSVEWRGTVVEFERVGCLLQKHCAQPRHFDHYRHSRRRVPRGVWDIRLDPSANGQNPFAVPATSAETCAHAPSTTDERRGILHTSSPPVIFSISTSSESKTDI